MTHKGIIITSNNDIRVGEFAAPLYKTIGAAVGGYIEIVHPQYLPRPFVMIVDDEGLLKEYPVNMAAGYLYGTPFHGHPIVGDVVIMKEGYTEDGPDIVGLTADDLIAVMDHLMSMLTTIRTIVAVEPEEKEGS